MSSRSTSVLIVLTTGWMSMCMQQPYNAAAHWHISVAIVCLDKALERHARSSKQPYWWELWCSPLLICTLLNYTNEAGFPSRLTMPWNATHDCMPTRQGKGKVQVPLCFIKPVGQIKSHNSISRITRRKAATGMHNLLVTAGACHGVSWYMLWGTRSQNHSTDPVMPLQSYEVIHT